MSFLPELWGPRAIESAVANEVNVFRGVLGRHRNPDDAVNSFDVDEVRPKLSLARTLENNYV